MLESTLGRRSRSKEKIIRWALFATALFSVATTAGIIGVLARETFHFFREVSPGDFLFGTEWRPLFVPRSFGVPPCSTAR